MRIVYAWLVYEVHQYANTPLLNDYMLNLIVKKKGGWRGAKVFTKTQPLEVHGRIDDLKMSGRIYHSSVAILYALRLQF